LNPDKKQANFVRNIAVFSGIAVEMAAIIGLGVWAGRLADKKFSLEIPWFTVLFSLIAVFLSLYYTYSNISKWLKKRN
jgi:F0F1-type ATP synthase assembly protein I